MISSESSQDAATSNGSTAVHAAAINDFLKTCWIPTTLGETGAFNLGGHHVGSGRHLTVIRLKFHHGIDTIVSAIDHNRLACDIAGVA